MVTLLTLLILAAPGDSCLTQQAVFELRSAPPEAIGPHAYYMSLGPIDTTSPGEPRKLRVTLSDCERSVLFTIDEILIGHADSRLVTTQYNVNLLHDLRSIYPKGPCEGRIPGDGRGSYFEHVRWLSPSAFEIVTQQDTLSVQRLEDSRFLISRRQRTK